MHRAFPASLAAALLCAASIAAQAASPLEGSWKQDPTTIELPKDPSRYSLADGTYECSTCVPPIRVPADGKDHPLKGHRYDTLAVKVEDDRTVTLDYKADMRLVMRQRVELAADGRSMLRHQIDLLEDNTTVTGTRLWERVNTSSEKGHAMSGAWRAVKIVHEPDVEPPFRITIEGQALSMQVEGGTTYRAYINGKRAPVDNDPTAREVAVKMPNASTLVETTFGHRGVPVTETRMVASPDGKSLKVSWRNLRSGTSGGYVARRQ